MLPTVVGVLIEVPVMLSVVKIANASRGWYERGGAVRQNGGALGAHREDCAMTGMLSVVLGAEALYPRGRGS